MIRKFYDTELEKSGGTEPTKEEVKKVVEALMGTMSTQFEENQKKPFQYVVAYYGKNDEFLGYHADTWCNLTQSKESGKRYSGENPYSQLATIRKNLDYTLEMTEEKAKNTMFGVVNLSIKEKYFKDLTKDDIFIEANYLDEGTPPQRFIWKELTSDNG